MKILRLNPTSQEARILVQSNEDLIPLSRIIEKGDVIVGKTERKIKIGDEGGRQRVSRKTITLELQITKLVSEDNALRVQGRVTKPTEDVPMNSSHTIEVSSGTDFKLKKANWFRYQIDQLKDAEKTSQLPTFLLCVLDDEQASFGYLSPSGIKYDGKLNLRLTKKRLEEKKQDDIKKVAKEIVSRAKNMQVIIASPLFWKDIVSKAVKDLDPRVAKKLLLANVSTGSKKGLNELLSTGVVDKLMKGAAITKHEQLINKLLEGIAKNKLSTYGVKEVEKAAISGAVTELLISEKLMSPEIQDLIQTVESGKGHVHIFDTKSDAGKKLLGLSGIAALLKFKI